MNAQAQMTDAPRRAGVTQFIFLLVVIWLLLAVAGGALARNLARGADSVHAGSFALIAAFWVSKVLPLSIAAALPPTLGWLTWKQAGLGRHRVPARRALNLTLAAGGLCVCFAVGCQFVVRALSAPQQGGTADAAGVGAILLALLIFTVPSSASEELLFRGPVQGLANMGLPGRLRIGRLAVRHGTLATALGFGLIHLAVGGGAPVGFAVGTWRLIQASFGTAWGIIFGYVRDETGAVWVSALLHSLVNGSLQVVFLVWPLG